MAESGGFRAMQMAVAGLLLAAAVLKTHQLATEPVMGSGWLDSRWLLIAVVEFEFFFACWLLSGLLPVWTWRATLVLFSAFALVSLDKALSGEASCGCFGTVAVNPWVTLLLDFGVLAGSLLCRPAKLPRVGGEVRVSRLRWGLTVGLWLATSVASGTAMARYQPTRLSDAGELLGDGRTVVLEPETWVGKRFPLLDWIDVGDRIANGRWFVVLHYLDCPYCQAVIRDAKQLARTRERSTDMQFAFIEISRDLDRGRATDLLDSTSVRGRLSDEWQWFGEAPIQLVLIDGKVVAASKGGHTLSSFAMLAHCIDLPENRSRSNETAWAVSSLHNIVEREDRLLDASWDSSSWAQLRYHPVNSLGRCSLDVREQLA